MRKLLFQSLILCLFCQLGHSQVDTFEIQTETYSEPIGWQEFRRYVAKEMKYPKADKDAGIEGNVFIEFIVEKDGSVTNVKVRPGTNKNATSTMVEEAIRVVESSPTWKPKKKKGKPVRCKYVLPFRFKEDAEPKKE